MPTAIQTPRLVDLDPQQAILLELTVISMILAQSVGMGEDEVANLRASIYADYMATTTLTTGAPTGT
jgi:hypothetical protein